MTLSQKFWVPLRNMVFKTTKRKRRSHLWTLRKFLLLWSHPQWLSPHSRPESPKLQIARFKAKVKIDLETQHYRIKTVENALELQQALSLRHDVFWIEGVQKHKAFGMDWDSYDWDCDHLIAIDKRSGRVVGTYRFNCSAFSKRFYSEQEFDLSAVKALPGVKVELGRACLHASVRNGRVLQYLWEGMKEYFRKTDAQYAFGCSSLKFENAALMAKLCLHLKQQGLLEERIPVYPNASHAVPRFTEMCRFYESEYRDFWDFSGASIPSLLRFYLKSGAKVCGRPAWDDEFQCFDLFTLLKVSEFSFNARRNTPHVEVLR